VPAPACGRRCELSIDTTLAKDFGKQSASAGMASTCGANEPVGNQRHEVRVFASAEEFLNSAHRRKAACLILDVRLPGLSGIELHRHLLARKCKVPVIFITAHASDQRARSEAASDWTVAYLIKPFTEDDLLGAVAAALNWQPAP
jgi:FixJ family two-component response regulator